MKQVHQRMTEWCGRGGLQPARLVHEMVRELACPVVDVENSAVHGKDEEAGPGRRGRCGGCGEIWLSDNMEMSSSLLWLSLLGSARPVVAAIRMQKGKARCGPLRRAARREEIYEMFKES
jgi:hypothetical protein